ncbi:MAG: hypothetical protein JNK58_05520 [Phycisphaerae bacterium]|nr:hypothetical protein [Phycisphaerae bacterium]
MRRLCCFFPLLLAACAAPSTPDEPRPVVTPLTAPEQREGLDVVWWVADDSEGSIARTLASFVEPPHPTDAALRERWHATGLRLIRIPLDRFPEVQRRLPPVAPRYRLPVGWTAEWTEVFRGRRLAAQSWTIAGQPRALGSGVARFLARCWPTPPSPGGSVAFHFDLAFQVDHSVGNNTADPFSQPATIREEDRGEIVREITLSTTLEPGFAYIVTCDAPEAIWKPSLVGPANETETGFSPPDEIEMSAPKPRRRAGPILPVPITLGEAALQIDPDNEASHRYKPLIAFVIHAERDFRLLP